MNPARLSITQIRKVYGTGEAEVEILRNVSFGAESGETIAILGPSGSGKSTLLNIIGSLDTPTAGRVHLGDIDVTRLSTKQLAQFRARAVGFVFQEHHLLPQLTAVENVILPTLALSNPEDATDRALSLLAKMGLASRANAFPAKLSGGERQRVAIARAMINSPQLLLCDEPSGNLDRETADSIISLFCKLAADDAGVIVVMVTHNHEHADQFCRRLVLKNGELIEQQPSPKTNPRPSGNGALS